MRDEGAQAGIPLFHTISQEKLSFGLGLAAAIQSDEIPIDDIILGDESTCTKDLVQAALKS